MGTELGEVVSKFGIGLLQELISDKENVLFSPSSLAVALCMTMAGADGNTREQMLEVLKCGKDEAGTQNAFARLVKVMQASVRLRVWFRRAQSCALHNAVRLYGTNDFEAKQSFIKTLATSYRSDFKQVWFTDSDDRDDINIWVYRTTKHKIKEIIPKGIALHDSTQLALVNAIYFKGKWLEEFNEESIYQGYFYVNKSKTVRVEMMTKPACETYHLYAEDETCQAIQLRYQGGSLSMIIILPKEIGGLSSVVDQLNAHTFLNLISSMQSTEVEVHLPKFTIEESYNLPKQLANLGMTDMFTAADANFSRLAKDPEGLYVSDVIHKACIEVDEEGGEAAHLAARGRDPLLADLRIEPVIFKADHPFIFSIFDRRSGCPIFYGTLVRPQQ